MDIEQLQAFRKSGMIENLDLLSPELIQGMLPDPAMMAPYALAAGTAAKGLGTTGVGLLRAVRAARDTGHSLPSPAAIVTGAAYPWPQIAAKGTKAAVPRLLQGLESLETPHRAF